MSDKSTVADHCKTYALSDPKDCDYSVTCDHEHNNRCDWCEIEMALQKVWKAKNIEEVAKEEAEFTIRHSREHIIAWKSHHIRYINQDQARVDILEKLDRSSVFLVQDWAMKYLPRKYRESQSDWFGKRGISWHISVATRRGEGENFELMTFVHVLESCSQDYCAVIAIMADVIKQLKKAMPQLSTLYYRQDNACCYHNGPTILSAKTLGQDEGVRIKRLDFSDPQGGKGSCDRKAATIKSHMRLYQNAGNDVATGDEMVKAMKSSGGVPGVAVKLSQLEVDEEHELSTMKLTGVSLLFDFCYEEEGLRSWKAYKIGPGKVIPWTKLITPSCVDLPSLRSTHASPEEDQILFSSIKSKRKNSKASSTENKECKESTVSDSKEDLFSCPEEGCIKVYQRFSDLQYHLDCGRHDRIAEQETLLDKAVLNYASKIEQRVEPLPNMQPVHTLGSTTKLRMGWALKISSQRKRFSQRQKDYLLARFKLGESSGKKENAVLVAKGMVKAKDSDGNRLFTAEEFLTSKQIFSFFNRLAAKKKLETDTDGSDADEEELFCAESAEREKLVEELTTAVVQEVALQHPITYDIYNICELSANSKLSKFAISVLSDICRHLGIDISDITVKRKQPYVDKLNAFCNGCVCKKTSL